MRSKARVEGGAAKPRRARKAPAASKGAQGESYNGDPRTNASSSVTSEDGPRKLANPVPGDDGDALDRIAASFQERFPAEWEAWRLCPLQHGVNAMANLLRGKG